MSPASKIQFSYDSKNNEHILEAEQFIARPVAEVFKFFCDENNLEILTPEFLNFKVLGKSTPTIQEGTLIDYKLSLHGIPLRWRTKIESWNPENSFVDTQLKGPYKLWHHTHTFEAKDGGTMAKDRVRFRLPFGPLGNFVVRVFVRRNVQKIFEYRTQKIGQIFSQA